MSLLVPHTYASIESINGIILSSFAVKAILLISSVTRLCLSLLKLCYIFDINFFLLLNSLSSPLTLFTSILFFLDGLFYFQVELLLSSFYNLQI